MTNDRKNVKRNADNLENDEINVDDDDVNVDDIDINNVDDIDNNNIDDDDKVNDDDSDANPFVWTQTFSREFEQRDDGLIVARPVYNNDQWAESSIRKLSKFPNKKKKTEAIFYIRRDTSPDEFIIDDTSDNQRETQSTMDNNEKRSIESWAKLLTFHPDGTFTWPECSKHLCWNCCHAFDGPPAMIPRKFNRVYKYYQVYGNFCTWSCAKRYALDHFTDEYSSTTAPSLDYFAWKYFGAHLPIPLAPARILLGKGPTLPFLGLT
jgi:hypothetical protein